MQLGWKRRREDVEVGGEDPLFFVFLGELDVRLNRKGRI